MPSCFQRGSTETETQAGDSLKTDPFHPGLNRACVRQNVGRQRCFAHLLQPVHRTMAIRRLGTGTDDVGVPQLLSNNGFWLVCNMATWVTFLPAQYIMVSYDILQYFAVNEKPRSDMTLGCTLLSSICRRNVTAKSICPSCAAEAIAPLKDLSKRGSHPFCCVIP